MSNEMLYTRRYVLHPQSWAALFICLWNNRNWQVLPKQRSIGLGHRNWSSDPLKCVSEADSKNSVAYIGCCISSKNNWGWSAPPRPNLIPLYTSNFSWLLCADVNSLIPWFLSCCFTWVKREANSAAHELASLASSLQSSLSCNAYSLPPSVLEAWQRDMLGLSVF